MIPGLIMTKQKGSVCALAMVAAPPTGVEWPEAVGETCLVPDGNGLTDGDPIQNQHTWILPGYKALSSTTTLTFRFTRWSRWDAFSHPIGYTHAHRRWHYD